MNSPVVVSHPRDLHTLLDAELPTTEWSTLEQRTIDLFAESTGDHQWIHVDADRAKDGPYGTTIAHGYLSLALVGPLFARVLHVENASRIINYGLEKVRFPAPLPVDSRIRLASRLISVTDVDGGVQVVVNAEVQGDRSGKPFCVAHPVFRYYE